MEGGSIKGNAYVGGVVGNNRGTVSNCYNNGDVEGNSNFVGGVVGNNGGTVSNCYNNGDVEGRGNCAGGVVGYNGGTVSNCYNVGAVTGRYEVGGVVGDNDGTVSNCYYNKSICQISAIGSGTSGTYVAGLTTDKMTGTDAMTSLIGFKDENGKSEWIVRENSLGTYYYPHLKGFAYDATGDVKDWPATISSGYTYELDSDAFVYDGKVQKPIVTVKKNGDEVEGAPYSFTFVESVNAGEYTIEFENTETHVKGVIPYSIKKRALKITACKQTFTYNGQTQGPGDTTYEEKKKIEELIIIGGAGLADTHSISNITLDGQGDEAKTYEKELIPYNAVIVNTDGDVVTTNYEIEYIPGDLIISPIPVTLTANSGITVTYDGTEKTVSGYTCSVEGLTFDGVTAGVSATKTGTYEVTFSGVKVNETKDFTGYYMVTKTENGTLTINRKPLTITADSASAECDGTILIKNSYKCSELAAGDTIKSVTITGSQTGPGSSDNVPSAATIVNAAGEDVTDCYEITYVNGTLTVSEHSFDQEVADANYLKSAADCTHVAVYYKSCKCGEKGTETFESGEPLGHDYKAVEGSAVAPTCEKAGKEADQKCERCGDVITGKEIPATGHTFDKEAVDVKYLKSAADCTHAAVYYKSCACGEKGTETFESGEPFDHDYKTVEGSAVDPTCENAGKEADQKCERCGDVITGKEIAATGHTWKAATGYAPKTCEICGATEGDVIKYNSETGKTIEHTKDDTKDEVVTYHRSEDDKNAIDHYKGVRIDGKDVKVDAKSGSVIITFDAATLNALSVGDHVITVIFDDWVDELKLVIKAPVAPIADATPTTGDSSLPVLWVTLLLLSMAGASAVVMRRRNNRREILCEIGETD